MAILTLASSVCLPSFRGYWKRFQMTQLARQIEGNLVAARGKAMDMGLTVFVNISTNGGPCTIAVSSDDNRDGRFGSSEQTFTRLPVGGISISPVPAQISFTPAGESSRAAGSGPWALNLTSSKAGNRYLKVYAGGTVTVSR